MKVYRGMLTARFTSAVGKRLLPVVPARIQDCQPEVSRRMCAHYGLPRSRDGGGVDFKIASVGTSSIGWTGSARRTWTGASVGAGASGIAFKIVLDGSRIQAGSVPGAGDASGVTAIATATFGFMVDCREL